MVSPSEARVESSWSTAVAGDEPSPHGVTLRFRVLTGDRVADRWVISLRSTVGPPRARSCGLPSISPAARRDTRGHPLLRLRPPSGCCPLLPPAARRHAGTLSWGLVPYSASRRGRLRSIPRRFPRLRVRSALRVRALSAVCSALDLPAIFRPERSWGCSLQGFPLASRCSGSSPMHCPLDVSPAVGHPPPRKKGPLACSPWCLGSSAAPLVVLRALLSLRVRSRPGRYSPPGRPFPSWASSSPGSVRDGRGHVEHAASRALPASHSPGFPRGSGPRCAPECLSSEAAASSLSRAPSPPEVLCLRLVASGFPLPRPPGSAPPGRLEIGRAHV